MERRGHPVGGAVAGAIFFFFLGLTLMLFGLIPLAGPWLAFPLAGIVLGAIWGAWAPIGRKRPKAIGFTPIVPLGEPTGRTWTVRPVTGEVAAVPHENALHLQPMPVNPEDEPAVAPEAGPEGPVVAGSAASPWAPEPTDEAPAPETPHDAGVTGPTPVVPPTTDPPTTDLPTTDPPAADPPPDS